MNELKNAILTVLRTQYKYEAPAAFKTVERAGYDVYKYDGVWVIRNKETWKSLKLYNGRLSLSHGGVVKAENVEKVDIINYLNKPVNRAWWDILNAGVWGTPTQNKVNKLRWKKIDLAEHEAKLEKLTKQLEEERNAYIKATKELLVFRVQNGLKV